MTAEPASLSRIETNHPFRGIGGMLGVELRVWFPWRVLLLTIAGLGIYATIYIPWRISGVKQLGALFLWSMALWLIFLLFATISLSEGTVLGDIERGTASWLVGMPIGRPAVIAAKAAASAAGVSAAVYIVGGVLYPLFEAASREGVTRFRVDELTEVTSAPIGKWGVYVTLPEAGQYFAILTAIALLGVFLVAVMIALGSMIRSRTAVFGMGLACFAALMVGWLIARDALAVSPVGLVTAVTEGLQTKPIELAVPAAATVASSLALVALATWNFGRRELS